VAILKSQGLIRKKGTVEDLKRMFGGQRGFRMNQIPTGVDKSPEDS